MRFGNKYHARKAKTQDGERFDSVKEARRWNILSARLSSGEITDLRRQVRYEIIPSQKDADGRCVERAVFYVADFVYTDLDGNTHVEDVKGYRDGGAYRLFVIKRKLMLYRFGIKIEEI